MRSMSRSRFLPCLLLAAALGSIARAAEKVDYQKQIKPLLSSRCYACHAALKQKSDLRLDTAAAMRKGGKHGPAIKPLAANQSLLIERIASSDPEERMPPEGDPLKPEQIELLREWIAQGAVAPANEKPEEDPRQHWAFQPPVRPALPKVKAASWSRNPIDRFVSLEHEKRGLKPQPQADKEILLRRVYLDLIGLPPTREELHRFLADRSPDAYERVVDELLSRPQYGERWARHWMDVWRYSDWFGRRAVPDVWNSAPQIWRWRDWIVRSINADKGYDRMVMEMLAGDELAPNDDETLAATGYLVRNWYALNPNQWMRDNVEHTAKGFLGLTLNCAHCHDHKYDPILQKDYFQFRAFFEPLDLRQDRLPGEADPGPFEKYEYSKVRKPQRLGLIRVFDEHPDKKTYLYRGGDERNRFEGEPSVEPSVPWFFGKTVSIQPVNLPIESSYPGSKPAVQEAETKRCESAVATAQSALEKAQQALAKASTSATNYTDLEAAVALSEAKLATAQTERDSVQARIAADRVKYHRADGDAPELTRHASQAERTHALRLAEEKALAAEHNVATSKRKADAAVEAKDKEQTQAALKKAQESLAAAQKAVSTATDALKKESAEYKPLTPLYPATSTGRRLALARWLVARDNPLTARVAVNHIWMRHFHSPLVESVYDFGRAGKRPSHPELLDWLAVEFMESGWDMKHLHRLIVTSQAYRLASSIGDVKSRNTERDRDNHFLWHMNTGTLESEVTRDSILYLAGELDLQMGGQEIENNLAGKSHRRSLYFSIHPEEGGHADFVKLFNPPEPGECYRRTDSVVPQQALALMNSKLTTDEARLLARKLSEQLDNNSGPNEQAFVTAAFEQVLSRKPRPAEITACQSFLQKQVGLYTANPTTTPDPKTADGALAPATEPAKRARESLVHTLFSHSDFVTIR